MKFNRRQFHLILWTWLLWLALFQIENCPAAPILVDRERLLSQAKLSAGYLVRSVRPDGSFVYRYDLKKNVEEPGYNILRHAGTIFAMADLYGEFHDPKMKAGMDRTISFLEKQLVPGFGNDSKSLLVREGAAVKLGGNGLALVALAEYSKATGSKDKREVMEKLALGILSFQEPSGRFKSKLFYPSGKDSGFVSEYYPGEALLGLVRLNQLFPDPRWLAAAERGADWLISVRDQGKGLPQLPHDHWLLYALSDLYRASPKALYLDHIIKLTDAIRLAQILSAENPAWVGGYYNPPRSAPTSTRNEGLCAAYQLLKELKNPKAKDVLETLSRGLEFQLRTLVSAEDARQFPDPERAVGAVREDLTSSMVQIDYVQHSTSALLCAAGK